MTNHLVVKKFAKKTMGESGVVNGFLHSKAYQQPIYSGYMENMRRQNSLEITVTLNNQMWHFPIQILVRPHPHREHMMKMLATKLVWILGIITSLNAVTVLPDSKNISLTISREEEMGDLLKFNISNPNYLKSYNDSCATKGGPHTHSC